MRVGLGCVFFRTHAGAGLRWDGERGGYGSQNKSQMDGTKREAPLVEWMSSVVCLAGWYDASQRCTAPHRTALLRNERNE